MGGGGGGWLGVKVGWVEMGVNRIRNSGVSDKRWNILNLKLGIFELFVFSRKKYLEYHIMYSRI